MDCVWHFRPAYVGVTFVDDAACRASAIRVSKLLTEVRCEDVECVVDGCHVRVGGGDGGALRASLLVERMADGNGQAFDEFYDLITSRVWALIVR